jgi:hypothetical protein
MMMTCFNSRWLGGSFRPPGDVSGVLADGRTARARTAVATAVNVVRI